MFLIFFIFFLPQASSLLSPTPLKVPLPWKFYTLPLHVAHKVYLSLGELQGLQMLFQPRCRILRFLDITQITANLANFFDSGPSTKSSRKTAWNLIFSIAILTCTLSMRVSSSSEIPTFLAFFSSSSQVKVRSCVKSANFSSSFSIAVTTTLLKVLKVVPCTTN